MTASKHVTLWCDGEGCKDFVEIGEASNAGHARDVARVYGWVDRGRYDYCPRHRPLSKRDPYASHMAKVTT